MERLIPILIAKWLMTCSRIIVHWLFGDKLIQCDLSGNLTIEELRDKLQKFRTQGVQNLEVTPPLKEVDPEFFGGEEEKEAFLEEFSDVLEKS